VLRLGVWGRSEVFFTAIELSMRPSLVMAAFVSRWSARHGGLQKAAVCCSSQLGTILRWIGDVKMCRRCAAYMAMAELSCR
jgi:hypothetical protein